MPETPDDRRPDHPPSHRMPVRNALTMLAAIAWNVTTIPVACGTPIYRWISPNGVVNYGDQAPRGAREVQIIPAPPSAPPPKARAPTNSGPPAEEGAPSPAFKARTAIDRLNLLAALNNYRNSLQAARTPPPQNVYLPGFIGPQFSYGPHRFHERHRQYYHRQTFPPSRRPPMVLLPPPAPNSAYSSPTILP